MKKAYINPEISNVLMSMEDMIAASPEDFNKNLDNENSIAPEDILSRRHSVWDDEE
jgi:hypothetical protein